MYIPPKRRILNIISAISVPLVLSFTLASCTNAKKVPYFQDVPDSLQSRKTVTTSPYVEQTIQPNDILSVSVETIDQRNIAVGTERQGSSTIDDKGYAVDKNGYIDVPLVGHIQVSNLTSTQAKELIRDSAKRFYVNPIVNVRILNYFISVLGDVAKPGRINVIQEKVSIMDAISLAGDLNITARRDNVLLIREIDGKKLFVRFNLNSTDIYTSPYYYLHTGDFIYVEPIKAKSRSATTDSSRDRYITLTSAVISIVVLLYTVFKK